MITKREVVLTKREYISMPLKRMYSLIHTIYNILFLNVKYNNWTSKNFDS